MMEPRLLVSGDEEDGEMEEGRTHDVASMEDELRSDIRAMLMTVFRKFITNGSSSPMPTRSPR